MFSAGGDSYSAMNQFHRDMANKKVGDDVQFTWTQKGNYKRVTGWGASGGGAPQSQAPNPTPASGGQTPSPSDGQPGVLTGPPNLGMMVSYGKDLMVGNVAGTVDEAVAIMQEMLAKMAKPAPKPSFSASYGSPGAAQESL